MSSVTSDDDLFSTDRTVKPPASVQREVDAALDKESERYSSAIEKSVRRFENGESPEK